MNTVGKVLSGNFYEEESMYLEIAKKQYGADEYTRVRKQFIEGRHPESKKYNEDEKIINEVNKKYEQFNE